MSEEIKEVHIKTYDEWLKYYENATKEQVIEDLTHDVQYFADAVKDIKSLQQKVEQLENIRKEAIEYVKNNCLYEEEYDYDEEDNLIWKGAYDYKAQEDLLNILNKGSDKE